MTHPLPRFAGAFFSVADQSVRLQIPLAAPFIAPAAGFRKF